MAAAEDEDVDIDGDIEDTRFLPEPQATASRSISPITSSSKRKHSNASSSKLRPKEKEKSSKSSKPSKKRRQVVFTDSEEEDFDDPDVVVTDDDDFEPEPDHGLNKKGVKPRGVKLLIGGAKGKAAKKEEKEITFRDERKLPPTAHTAPEFSKRVDEGSKPPDPLDEPILKKRKLPPIKKNKPAGGTSTGSSTPAASKPSVAVSVEKKETLTPALTSNQVGTRKLAGASSDINLLDSSVYSELFRSAVRSLRLPLTKLLTGIAAARRWYSELRS